MGFPWTEMTSLCHYGRRCGRINFTKEGVPTKITRHRDPAFDPVITNPRGALCFTLYFPVVRTALADTFSPRLLPTQHVSDHVSDLMHMRLVHCLHAVLQYVLGDTDMEKGACQGGCEGGSVVI